MNLKKNKMPTRDAKERIKDFDEVALGYSEQIAVNEAQRCLNCKNKPCVAKCPVSIDIPEFIEKIKEKDFYNAYDIINKNSSLPAICGRVCPQETQCESACVRGIKGQSVGIGHLERFVADLYNKNKKPEKITLTKQRVAVVGGGPAGLSCADKLSKLGYRVTIFEALHKCGGVLVYGIPEFRLPKAIVKQEIGNLKTQGVEIKTNIVIGKTKTIDDLFKEGYKSVFIGSGAGLPRFMDIEGEFLNGVYSANEYLTRINLMQAYKSSSDTPIHRFKNIVVVGGGNVAMDCARSAIRMGSDNVYIVYRRTKECMPARVEEIEHAKEEGIVFKTLKNPIKINGDEKNNVKSITVVDMELKDIDKSGRGKPVPIEGSEFEIETDCVIMAIGTSPNHLIHDTTPDIKIKEDGTIIVDEKTMETRVEGVYAGGDAVSGAATVINAMGVGKKAAKNIDLYLKNNQTNFNS